MKKALLSVLALTTFVGQAHATSFVELEPNGSPATAQHLVHDGSIIVTGFREAIAVNTFTDFFRFYASAGDNLSFSVTALGGGDPAIQLRTVSDLVLAENDDAAFGTFDSLINYSVSQSGDYIAAVRGFANSTYSYQMRVTGLTATPSMGAVPEPATWAMMILGMGAVGGAMRRRRVQTLAVA